MADFKNARVGDKCYHLQFGEMIITRIGYDTIDAVPTNEHHGITCVVFYTDGRYNSDDESPLVYHSKPAFCEPPPPKRKVKKTFWINWYEKKSGEIIALGYYHDEETAVGSCIFSSFKYLGAFPTEIEYEEK